VLGRLVAAALLLLMGAGWAFVSMFLAAGSRPAPDLATLLQRLVFEGLVFGGPAALALWAAVWNVLSAE